MTARLRTEDTLTLHNVPIYINRAREWIDTHFQNENERNGFFRFASDVFQDICSITDDPIRQINLLLKIGSFRAFQLQPFQRKVPIKRHWIQGPKAYNDPELEKAIYRQAQTQTYILKTGLEEIPDEQHVAYIYAIGRTIGIIKRNGILNTISAP